jgi:hypothetical protein
MKTSFPSPLSLAAALALSFGCTPALADDVSPYASIAGNAAAAQGSILGADKPKPPQPEVPPTGLPQPIKRPEGLPEVNSTQA